MTLKRPEMGSLTVPSGEVRGSGEKGGTKRLAFTAARSGRQVTERMMASLQEEKKKMGRVWGSRRGERGRQWRGAMKHADEDEAPA